MKWATLSGVLLVLVLTNVDATAPVKSRPKRSIDLNDTYRFRNRQVDLPDDVVAVSYHLDLELFMDQDYYRGYVKIGMVCRHPTSVITLNVDPGISIESPSVRIVMTSPDRESRMNVERKEYHRSKPWYLFHLEQKLKPNDEFDLEMEYTVNLTSSSYGLFKNEYHEVSGKRAFVATYLRPDHAQMMFPCFDDPGNKAPFHLSVVRPKAMTALSNVPIEKSTEVDGKPTLVRDRFEATPLMATYQLALIVSEFGSLVPVVEAKEINGQQLRITVWGRANYLQYMEDVPGKIVAIVNYLQDYFNCSIGLSKLDIVALPSYSMPKPSDSWGLMFFKESDLNNPAIWSLAYEIIYQWIGQYVTPSTWRMAPENKALNSFLAFMTTIDINPDEIVGKWPMNVLYSLYYEFGKTIPFARVAGIRHEATATKTELLFRMFYHTLGKEQFRESIRRFIGNASQVPTRIFHPNDFYDWLNVVANESKSLPASLIVRNVAEVWLTRDRVPLVTVVRDYETGSVNFSQSVYRREPPPPWSANVAYQWDIPIVMVTQDKLRFNDTRPAFWMTQAREPQNVTIENVTAKDNFVIVNPEEIGMFPVNYDTCNWKMLSTYLQGPSRETIPALTRAKLLHDAWNLAYAGQLCFKIALSMTLFLKQERNHVVWEPVFTMIDHIGRRIDGSEVYPKFEAYIRTLLKSLYLELGQVPQADEPSWKTHIRGLAENFLCRTGYPPCVEKARQQFQKWMTNEEPDKGIPVANEFICPVFKWGTNEEWEFGLERVINFPQDPWRKTNSERTYLLKTLAGCPKDAYKIERLLNVTILDQNVNFTNADVQLIFSMLTSSYAGYSTLFDFLSKHWTVIKQRFENTTNLWDSIVHSATVSFNNQEGYDRVRKLYDLHQGEFGCANATIEDAFKKIQQEIEWTSKNVPTIKEWLDANLPEEESETSTMETTTVTAAATVDTVVVPAAG